MTPPKKFINHVLHNVDPAKVELTLDIWGSNGWEAYAVIPTAGKWTVFLKRELQANVNGNGNDLTQ